MTSKFGLKTFKHQKGLQIIHLKAFNLLLNVTRFLAEKEGFEPPDLLQSTVFKTAAFDRSAISPLQK